MIMLEPPPTGNYYVIQVLRESGIWMDTLDRRIESHFYQRIKSWRERYPDHEFRLVERLVAETVVPEGAS